MLSLETFDFPLKGTVTMKQIQEAQDRLLAIAVYVRDSLEKDNIPYFIIFGTLIGAVRHKGFIPWDLDFDMGVPEEYYDDALKAIAGGLPKWLVMQDQESDPNYCAFWSKVVDRNSEIHSTAFESDNHFKYKGLHLDLYKLKRTNNENYLYDVLCDNLQYYNLKYERGLITLEDHETATAPIRRELNSRSRKTVALDEYYFLKALKTKEYNLFPPRAYSFEGERFMGPADYDRILKDCYYIGDYMKPPLFEDRNIKVDAIELY